MIKRMKNNLGYTLGEIVMTTAIIGSLAAIAVPNYMRIKMNVNMEMVKQQLRILGQEMNEFYNKANPHQYPDTLPPTGNTEEELAITASLNGLNNKGYKVRHFPSEGGSSFIDRIDPMPGMFGVAGDQCYILDPMGQRTLVDCFSAEGIDMFILDESLMSGFIFNSLFSDPNINEAQKISILSGMFLQLGLYADWLSNPLNFESFMMASLPDQDGLPGLFAPMKAEDKPAFDQLVGKLVDRLKEYGVQIYLNDMESRPSMAGDNENLEYNQSPGVSFAIAFNSENPYEMLISSQTALKDLKAYIEYVTWDTRFENPFLDREGERNRISLVLFGQESGTKR